MHALARAQDFAESAKTAVSRDYVAKSEISEIFPEIGKLSRSVRLNHVILSRNLKSLKSFLKSEISLNVDTVRTKDL